MPTRFTAFATLGFVTMCLVTCARGQQPSDAAVAPFIDDQTLVVVRIDSGKVNPAGMVDWIVGKLAQEKIEQPGIDLVRRSWQPRADSAGALLTGLANAKATRLYWILSVADFSGARSLPEFWDRSRDKGVWAVPVSAGADTAAVERLLTADKGRDGRAAFESKNLGDVVVAAARGRLPHPGAAQLSSGWAQALAGDSPVQIAVVPGATLRRAFEENVGSFQTANGSVPITVFTRDVQWMSVSIVQPPDTKLSAVIQATDAGAASRVNDAVKQVLGAFHGSKIQLPFGLPPLENLETLVKFRVDGSRLRWTPDAAKDVEPLVVAELKGSINLLASSNMKQILLASIMHANNTKQFPADLPTVVKAQDLSPSVLKDPLHPQESVGYVYVKPADWQKDADKTPVLYEKWEGGKLVGFADGHVEALETRAEVEKLFAGRKAGK